MLHLQISNMLSSNHVKKKSLLLFILDYLSQLWLERKRVKIFNSFHKEVQMLRISEEEVEVATILMINKDKKKLEKN